MLTYFNKFAFFTGSQERRMTFLRAWKRKMTNRTSCQVQQRNIQSKWIIFSAKHLNLWNLIFVSSHILKIFLFYRCSRIHKKENKAVSALSSSSNEETESDTKSYAPIPHSKKHKQRTKKKDKKSVAVPEDEWKAVMMFTQ